MAKTNSPGRGRGPQGEDLAARLMAIDAELDRAADRLAFTVTEAAATHTRGWVREVTTAINRMSVVKSGGLARRQSLDPVVNALFNGASRVQKDGDRLIRGLPRMAEAAYKGLRAAGYSVSITGGPQVEAFGRAKRRDLESLLITMVREAQGIVERGRATGQDRGEVAMEVGEVLGLLPGRMSRWADTALLEFSQYLIMLNSKNEGTRGPGQPPAGYLYTGPIDSRCRPFCLRTVGRVWSRARIDKMDNRQLPNTFLTRGGYHCRHLWRPVKDATLLATMDSGRPVSQVIQGQLVAATAGSKVVKFRQWSA